MRTALLGAILTSTAENTVFLTTWFREVCWPYLSHRRTTPITPSETTSEMRWHGTVNAGTMLSSGRIPLNSFGRMGSLIPVKVYMSATLRVRMEDVREVPDHTMISLMADYMGPEWSLGEIKRNYADNSYDVQWIRARGVEDNL